MAEIISLTCPTCGAKLEVTEDTDRFACLHCGNEMLVIRRGGTVSLKPVVAELERVRVGTDRTASELAIRRLDEEIEALRHQRYFLGSGWEILGCASALGAFGICLLVSGVAGYAEPVHQERAGDLLVCAFPAIAVAAVLLVVWHQRWSKSNEEKRQLDSLIAKKMEERHRHEEMVQNVPSE